MAALMKNNAGLVGLLGKRFLSDDAEKSKPRRKPAKSRPRKTSRAKRETTTPAERRADSTPVSTLLAGGGRSGY